jgi:hypothetical protein
MTEKKIQKKIFKSTPDLVQKSPLDRFIEYIETLRKQIISWFDTKITTEPIYSLFGLDIPSVQKDRVPRTNLSYSYTKKELKNYCKMLTYRINIFKTFYQTIP